MSQSKDFFWLIQAPNISKQISRNGGATVKASRKTAHDKVFRPISYWSYKDNGWHSTKTVIFSTPYICSSQGYTISVAIIGYGQTCKIGHLQSIYFMMGMQEITKISLTSK